MNANANVRSLTRARALCICDSDGSLALALADRFGLVPDGEAGEAEALQLMCTIMDVVSEVRAAGIKKTTKRNTENLFENTDTVLLGAPHRCALGAAACYFYLC